MRAEVERAYQDGGLAAVVGAGPEEEEERSEPLLTVDEIVERTTNPRAGQSLTSMMIIQNKDQALERLRSGRAEITVGFGGLDGWRCPEIAASTVCRCVGRVG